MIRRREVVRVECCCYRSPVPGYREKNSEILTIFSMIEIQIPAPEPGNWQRIIYSSLAAGIHESAPVGQRSTCNLMVSESAPVMVTQGFVFKLNTFGNCVTQRPECLQSSGFQTTVMSPLVYFNFLSTSSS